MAENQNDVLRDPSMVDQFNLLYAKTMPDQWKNIHSHPLINQTFLPVTNITQFVITPLHHKHYDSYQTKKTKMPTPRAGWSSLKHDQIP